VKDGILRENLNISFGISYLETCREGDEGIVNGERKEIGISALYTIGLERIHY
jgi:hypothetical protein